MEGDGHIKLDSHREIHLNVGGQWYCIDKNVLSSYKKSKLYQAICQHGSDTNVLFVEGDGRMFQHVLNFVTTGELVLPPGFSEYELLVHEARETYGIRSLVDKIQSLNMNDSGENREEKGVERGHNICSRDFKHDTETNSGRPFLTSIDVLQKYPLLKQNSSVIWLTENGFAFINSDNDHFRHILNSCHHGVCLIPQDHFMANAFTKGMDVTGSKADKTGYIHEDCVAERDKMPAPSTDDIRQKSSPSIHVYNMAIEILQRYSSTQLGKLKLLLSKDGRGIVIHGTGSLFKQIDQWLGVCKLLLIEEISDFHDMCRAVKAANIPALLTAVEDFQRSPPFLRPVEHCDKGPCYSSKAPPTQSDDLLPGQNNDGNINCACFGPEVITVFVGDQIYALSRPILAEVASQSSIHDSVEGVLHLRGDGEIFRHILNYFRTGKLMLPSDFVEHDLLLLEANHMGISSLVSALDQPSTDFKKANDTEETSAITKKHKRAKKRRKVCSCQESLSAASEPAVSTEYPANLSGPVSVESEMVTDNEEIVSGVNAFNEKVSVTKNDAHSSRNTHGHSVFIKLNEAKANNLTLQVQDPSLQSKDKTNSSCDKHKLGLHQGAISTYQPGSDIRLQSEITLSRADHSDNPNSLHQGRSDNSAKQSGKNGTPTKFQDGILPSAAQRLMQMSKTVLKIQTSRKTDIPSCKTHLPCDSISNSTKCSSVIASLANAAQSGSKVSISTDHSYSHPPSKVQKLVSNKPNTLKAPMRAPSKPKLGTVSDSKIQNLPNSTKLTTGHNLHRKGAEDSGCVAVIKHPFVHGQYKDMSSPSKPFSTSRLYVGAPDNPAQNNVALPLLVHTRQLCFDKIRRSHLEVTESMDKKEDTVMAAESTEQTEDVPLDTKGNSIPIETVECFGTDTSIQSCALGGTPLVMACQTEEHLVIDLKINNKDKCCELKSCQEVAKTSKSPDASIESTPKGSIHLRNLTKLCSQLSWLHSVPQQVDIPAKSANTDTDIKKAGRDSIRDVSQENTTKENSDPNTEVTGKTSINAIHADSQKASLVAQGHISVCASPAGRESTKLPWASTPVEQNSQMCILLPLAAKDVIYARMCHRFLLGVIEDSKKLGDEPELTAEVARLVCRLWNADLTPSTFVGCLSQLAPFKSHTCEHLTPWIKRSLDPARWYALAMLELVEKHPSACSLTTFKVADML